jgi:hypothetical protein
MILLVGGRLSRLGTPEKRCLLRCVSPLLAHRRPFLKPRSRSGLWGTAVTPDGASRRRTALGRESWSSMRKFRFGMVGARPGDSSPQGHFRIMAGQMQRPPPTCGTGNQEGWHGARLRLHGRSDGRFLAAHSGVRRELGACRSGCALGAAWAAPVIPSTQPRRP